MYIFRTIEKCKPNQTGAAMLPQWKPLAGPLAVLFSLSPRLLQYQQEEQSPPLRIAVKLKCANRRCPKALSLPLHHRPGPLWSLTPSPDVPATFLSATCTATARLSSPLSPGVPFNITGQGHVETEQSQWGDGICQGGGPTCGKHACSHFHVRGCHVEIKSL